MSYSKQDLTEALIEFKNKHNRYPTRQDFKAKRITPSKNTFYRIFGNMENALKQTELYEKGDLVLEEERKIKPIKPISKKGGFQCPFCGSYTNNAEEYYSSLSNILIMRFMKLLKSNNGQSYFEGVMDCIHAVFRDYNPGMRKMLEAEGYLDAFEQRHSKMDKDIEYKLKCGHCIEWKWEEQITIDDSKVARLICEDCLSKKQEK